MAKDPVVFDYHVPRPPLSDFVALFWYWRGHEEAYSRERLLPMGTTELVIDLSNTNLAGAGLSGPQSEAFIIERTVQDELLGVHFRAGGVFPFVRGPVADLHGLHVGLSDLWGERKSGELLCRLHEAPSIALKFRVLEQWLLSVAARSLKHHPAVWFAMKEFERDPGLSSTATVADRAGFSQRHFIRMFHDEVGLTPKLFCRIRRFQRVIQVAHKCNDVDWADVALAYGYFDQSHFNHDFREFSGLTPTEYLRLRTSHTNHVQEPL